MATTGQTINDRLNAVRYALVGQGLARTVCKATTEEVLGPKKKHIDYLIACTNEPNVSIPQIANLLIERTQHTSWTVVFKSLISIHQLMSNGNERITQYLATSNHSFDLADFMDRTTPQGYNMSTFVRRYAKYINDKSISYRTLAIDLCKIRSGNDNALRTVNMDKLSKMLPIVQAQFDSLLEFGATSKDLNNGIIMSAFRLLYKDLVKLYVAYQEAIINLLERYFKLGRKKAREALEMYKTYLARMDKVAEFLSVVDSVGLDKSEMPDLTKSPASILKLLEQHLAQLEAKKRGTTSISPEAEEEGDNKENELAKETSIESSEQKDVCADQKQEDQSSSKVLSTETAQAAGKKEPLIEKHQPPQMPARPSPKAPPVVSSSTSKLTSTPNSSATPPHPPPPAHHLHQQQDPKKAATPPERPAKPPSRPPPPSSVVQAPVASSTFGIDLDQTSKDEDQQTHAKTSAEAAPTPPPPNLPPPPHPPAPSSSPAPPASPKQESSNTNTNGNTSEGETRALCAAAISNPEDSNNVTLTTGGITNHHTVSRINNDVEQSEPNHVNNVSQVEVEQAPEELDMPPPPPPIDDFEEQEAAEVLPVDGSQEPVVNGQSEMAPNGGVD